MELRNLTPHDITIVNRETGEKRIVPTSGTVSRLTSKTVITDFIDLDGFIVEMTETRFGDIENLPGPKDGVIYIVSRPVADQAKDRDDVRIPNELIRDDNGAVIGCYSLGRV